MEYGDRDGDEGDSLRDPEH